ncbi:BET1-like protein [Portunus trituberculatus]|uniref:BET1-like protein n=1 Tax=Portunus trituberculatus TaxID=210409 RepID=A0A5B7FEM2_PORTR|nr:BET1-like protein [Portunus trituberculatus]
MSTPSTNLVSPQEVTHGHRVMTRRKLTGLKGHKKKKKRASHRESPLRLWPITSLLYFLVFYLALDIENEAYEHNRLLEGMGNDFSGSEGLMSGSINRVKNLLSSGRQNRKAITVESLMNTPTSLVSTSNM